MLSIENVDYESVIRFSIQPKILVRNSLQNEGTSLVFPTNILFNNVVFREAQFRHFCSIIKC